MSRLSLLAVILSFSTKASAMYENAPVFETSPMKLPSGVSYQDLRYGDGVSVDDGKRVNIQWSLKRSNGYSIDSSSNHDGVPFIFTVGASSTSGLQRAVSGLDQGIRGMKVGGIRRIVFPPDLAYVEGFDDGSTGPIPPGFGPQQRIKRVMNMLKDDVPGESFILDVKVTRVQ
jgi:FKBP-type peptidyl-prolyl cis-trans isomerase